MLRRSRAARKQARRRSRSSRRAASTTRPRPATAWDARSARVVAALTQDHAASAVKYLHGCDLGSGAACNELGYKTEIGRGVPKDVTRGYELYVKACGLGSALGCRNQAVGLKTGLGTKIDLRAARAQYEKACSHWNGHRLLRSRPRAGGRYGRRRRPRARTGAVRASMYRRQRARVHESRRDVGARARRRAGRDVRQASLHEGLREGRRRRLLERRKLLARRSRRRNEPRGGDGGVRPFVLAPARTKPARGRTPC